MNSNSPSIHIPFPEISTFSSKDHNPSSKHLSKHNKKRTPFENFFKSIKSKKKQNSSILKHPKKEYIRCKLIRGCKKCIRLLIKSPFPQELGKFSNLSPQALYCWDSMLSYYLKYKAQLKHLSSTQQLVPNKEIKSYNLKFCQKFFATAPVRNFFQLYVEFLFSDKDPERLCSEFNFSCCRVYAHTEECQNSWNELLKYLVGEMISEIGFSENQEKILENQRKIIEKQEKITEKQEIENCEDKIPSDLKLYRLEGVETQPKWVQVLIYRNYNFL
jgi:hypothetical protein